VIDPTVEASAEPVDTPAKPTAEPTPARGSSAAVAKRFVDGGLVALPSDPDVSLARIVHDAAAAPVVGAAELSA